MMKSQLAQPSRVTEPELTTPQPPSPRSKGVVLDRPASILYATSSRRVLSFSEEGCNEIMAFFTGNIAMPEIVQVFL